MARMTKEEKAEAMCLELTEQVLMVLADYQTMKAYTYAPGDTNQRSPLDAVYFAHGGEGLRLEVAQRIEDNARLIFGAPQRKLYRRRP